MLRKCMEPTVLSTSFYINFAEDKRYMRNHLEFVFSHNLHDHYMRLILQLIRTIKHKDKT